MGNTTLGSLGWHKETLVTAQVAPPTAILPSHLGFERKTLGPEAVTMQDQEHPMHPNPL